MARDPSLTLILGGARSGKSRHAESLIERLPGPWIYIATAQPLDEEMRARIALHRSRRGARWQTVEAPVALAAALEAVPDGVPVLVDCLTFWLSNLLLADADPDHHGAALAKILSRPRGPWIVVSSEVGLGIVPENALARRFRDAAGTLHQRIAASADHVVLMVAGLPLAVK